MFNITIVRWTENESSVFSVFLHYDLLLFLCMKKLKSIGFFFYIYTHKSTDMFSLCINMRYRIINIAFAAAPYNVNIWKTIFKNFIIFRKFFLFTTLVKAHYDGRFKINGINLIKMCYYSIIHNLPFCKIE